jgi:hypothetical protein
LSQGAKVLSSGPHVALVESLCQFQSRPVNLGEYNWSCIGSGIMATVMLVRAPIATMFQAGEGVVVKVTTKEKSRGMYHGQVVMQDVSEQEVDMTRFLWDVFGRTGLCTNLPQPYGTCYLGENKAYRPAPGSAHGVRGLLMRPLSGVQLGWCAAYNLEVYIGKMSAPDMVAAKYVDRFGEVLRAALFHAAFALHTVTTGLGGWWRHNDMHASNVGLQEFPGAEPALFRITAGRPDGPPRTSVFRVPMETVGVMLDLGSAALLPPLALAKDAWVASNYENSHGLAAVTSPTAMQGMSCEYPCGYYDLMTLLAATYERCVKGLGAQCVSQRPKVRDALWEFVRFYRHHLGYTDMVADWTKDKPTSLHNHSRLTLQAQWHARQNDGAFVSADSKGRPLACKLFTPAQFLCSEYFAAYRVAADGGGGSQTPRTMRPVGSSAPVTEAVAVATTATAAAATLGARAFGLAAQVLDAAEADVVAAAKFESLERYKVVQPVVAGPAGFGASGSSGLGGGASASASGVSRLSVQLKSKVETAVSSVFATYEDLLKFAFHYVRSTIGSNLVADGGDGADPLSSELDAAAVCQGTDGAVVVRCSTSEDDVVCGGGGGGSGGVGAFAEGMGLGNLGPVYPDMCSLMVCEGPGVVTVDAGDFFVDGCPTPVDPEHKVHTVVMDDW